MDEYSIVQTGTRDELGEGPTWSSRENALYWVDIFAPAVRRWNVRSGEVKSWPMPEPIGWLVERASAKGFIAGLSSGFYELNLEPMSYRCIGRPEANATDNRMNDAKVDRSGRIWAGTMHMPGTDASGTLYRLDADATWLAVDDGYTICNGPTFSLDGDRLYHTDSKRGVVYQFDMTSAGALTNKRVFVQFPDDWGSPDGMTTDSEGAVWIAHWGVGRVSRFSPDGEVMRTVSLPASQITSCAFGGEALDRLFITSAAYGRHEEPRAGCLFEIDPKVRGMAPVPFAG